MNNRLKRIVDRTMIYYVIIGILNFILCTAIMFVLFNVFGVSERISPLVNHGLGCLNWYLACRFILFRDKRSRWQEVARYLAEVIVCYLLSYFVIGPLLARVVLPIPFVRELFSFGGKEEQMVRGNCEMAIGSAAHAVLNYLGQRYFVFSGRFEHHKKIAASVDDCLPEEDTLTAED